MNNIENAVVLRNCAFMLKDGTKYMKKEHEKQFREAYEEAIKALEQTEWIPVSSGKFPTSYVAVEVTVIRKDKTWNQTPYIRLAEWHEGLKDWFEIPYPIDQPFGERLSKSDSGDATVVAWRPLPEPFKGDTE